MVIPYADVQNDLVPRFPRDLTTAEFDQAETLIEDASFWLGVWVPGLTEAITGNEQLQTAAKLLVVAMVRRALLAPFQEQDAGIASTSEAVGPWNTSVTFRNPEGNLYLYGRELDDITGLLHTNRAAAVSMRSPGL